MPPETELVREWLSSRGIPFPGASRPSLRLPKRYKPPAWFAISFKGSSHPTFGRARLRLRVRPGNGRQGAWINLGGGGGLGPTGV